MRSIAAAAILLGIAGCGALPRDVEGTSERVAASHIIRVGTDAPLPPEGRRFLSELAAETSAKPALRSAGLEALIHDLDRGALDVVVAPVRAEGALATQVTLVPPLDGSEEGDRPIALRALMRNGENRWIVTVERAARRAAGR